jgi:catechol 2,3-dioxygenase-like lactoylglutathione lyase family enzyme
MSEPSAGNEPFVTVAPEFFVRDIQASAAFYQRLGFSALRQEPGFAVMGLGAAHVLLAAEGMASSSWLASGPRGVGLNIRIMVDDADAAFERASDAGARLVSPIADRDYGLRDFIIADPDGFLLRFAAPVRG